MKRDKNNKILGGVCSGLAKEFNMSATIVRLIFILAFALWGIGPLVYLALWVILPLNEEVD